LNGDDEFATGIEGSGGSQGSGGNDGESGGDVVIALDSGVADADDADGSSSSRDGDDDE